MEQTAEGVGLVRESAGRANALGPLTGHERVVFRVKSSRGHSISKLLEGLLPLLHHLFVGQLGGLISHTGLNLLIHWRLLNVVVVRSIRLFRLINESAMLAARRRWGAVRSAARPGAHTSRNHIDLAGLARLNARIKPFFLLEA